MLFPSILRKEVKQTKLTSKIFLNRTQIKIKRSEMFSLACAFKKQKEEERGDG